VACLRSLGPHAIFTPPLSILLTHQEVKKRGLLRNVTKIPADNCSNPLRKIIFAFVKFYREISEGVFAVLSRGQQGAELGRYTVIEIRVRNRVRMATYLGAESRVSPERPFPAARVSPVRPKAINNRVPSERGKHPRARNDYDEETDDENYMNPEPGFQSGPGDSLDAD